eukprot:14602832-Heterocapsa_arctica.AAC.1
MEETARQRGGGHDLRPERPAAGGSPRRECEGMARPRRPACRHRRDRGFWPPARPPGHRLDRDTSSTTWWRSSSRS